MINEFMINIYFVVSNMDTFFINGCELKLMVKNCFKNAI